MYVEIERGQYLAAGYLQYSVIYVEHLEFLQEGPGTCFLHKKRVPGGFLGAPSCRLLVGLLRAPAHPLAKDPKQTRPAGRGCLLMDA
jgi:hypothetical protein